MVKEYGVRALRYSHKVTGADVLSIIAPQDANKVFSINFRTPVSDSMGIPHILEHSVLCGSDKYPVKEPFVDLMKGSLNTFLNAFTYPDRTCYPVASMNNKDFYNLLDVYLDAVLHPRALRDPQVMQQEGWHFEIEDPTAPLTLKGVVYNEMKGVYSSPDAGHYKLTQQGLFPNNSYRHDSGGDPLHIPNLTFAQFKAFHEAYYHPSNAKIFFYGDDDPIRRLDHIDGYLKEYSHSHTAKASVVAIQPKLDLSKSMPIKGKYPIAAEGEEKHMVRPNSMCTLLFALVTQTLLTLIIHFCSLL
jgi:presequence protease